MPIDRGIVARAVPVGAMIGRLFANPQAAYLHIHFAAPGCYAALVERV